MAFHLCCHIAIRLTSSSLRYRSRLVAASGYYYFTMSIMLPIASNVSYGLRSSGLMTSRLWTSSLALGLYMFTGVVSVVLWDINVLRLRRLSARLRRQASASSLNNHTSERRPSSTAAVVVRFKNLLIVVNILALLGLAFITPVLLSRAEDVPFEYVDTSDKWVDDDFFFIPLVSIGTPYLLLWFSWRRLPPLCTCCGRDEAMSRSSSAVSTPHLPTAKSRRVTMLVSETSAGDDRRGVPMDVVRDEDSRADQETRV